MDFRGNIEKCTVRVFIFDIMFGYTNIVSLYYIERLHIEKHLPKILSKEEVTPS
jgi:hypothetical protein